MPTQAYWNVSSTGGQRDRKQGNKITLFGDKEKEKLVIFVNIYITHLGTENRSEIKMHAQKTEPTRH